MSFIVSPRALAASVIATVAAVGTASASIIQTHNLVVLGNHQFQSDIHGRVWVGGNLSGNGDVGTMLTPRPSFLSTDVLTVLGNMNVNNINLEAGNLRLGGTRTGNVNFNGGGSQINDPTVITTATAVSNELFSTSAALAALPSNSTVSLPSGQPGPANFNANPGPNGVAVFNINASFFSNNLIQQIGLNLNGATSIVINVTGGSASYNTGNFVGAWTSAFARANTIWNFSQATSINLQRGFSGAILAPAATLTNNNDIDGSVFVGAFNQFGEVHFPLYTGIVPTPGAATLLALAGLAAVRRRRAA